MEDTDILDDERPIKILVGEQCDLAEVGTDGVTRIEPYRERGERGYIPWFKVWVADVLVERINASFVSRVVYDRTYGDKHTAEMAGIDEPRGGGDE